MINRFAEQLKSLREEKNLLQKDVADKLGVVRRTVSYWEQGSRECDFDMLIKIARFFDVTTDYLLGISDY